MVRLSKSYVTLAVLPLALLSFYSPFWLFLMHLCGSLMPIPPVTAVLTHIFELVYVDRREQDVAT